jgi:release factor glutamine methyltransferase
VIAPSTPPDPDPALVARLRAAGCVFAEDEAALLTEAAAGSEVELERLAARRVAGEPLEPLLGWAEFAGMRLRVEPGVFVPRHRTELLAERAAQAARPEATVLDLCCGVGAIGAVVLQRVPGVRLFAADIEPAAVRCARANLGPDGRVFEGDLFSALPGALRGTFDVIAVNAPYVPTREIPRMPPEARDHEPAVALDGGGDGLDVHRRIAAEAADWLTPGGVLLIEASDEQAPVSAALFEAAGLAAAVEQDDERGSTLVIARAAASS